MLPIFPIPHLRRSLLMSIMLIFMGSVGFSQVENISPWSPEVEMDDTANVVKVVAQKARYKGDINKDLSKYLEYPSDARNDEIEGIVRLSFIIDVDGSIKNIVSLSYPDRGEILVKEAIRVVKLLNKFEPAKDEHGKPVKVRYLIPIRFVLTD